MEKAMDVFGRALYRFSHGDKSPLYFESGGKRSAFALAHYFIKDPKRFGKLEKEALKLSKGKILDVGCGTCKYIPYLMKRGKVLGIDISAYNIRIGRETGLRNVRTADIFKFKKKEKYDTILLLQNNIGIGGTLPRTMELLKVLRGLLKPDGIILTDARATKKKFISKTITLSWKGKRSQSFQWAYFSRSYLRKLCDEAGLNIKVLDNTHSSYLAKITLKDQ